MPIEECKSRCRTDPQAPRVILQERLHSVTGQAPGRVSLAPIAPDALARGLHFRQSGVRPYPQVAMLIFQHGVHLHRTAHAEGCANT